MLFRSLEARLYQGDLGFRGLDPAFRLLLKDVQNISDASQPITQDIAQ
jgi:hypothetical protein